jgi:hypothetical protein
MPDKDLQHLVRRRLFELGISPEEASRRSGGDVPAATLRGLLRGQGFLRPGDRFARALARALDVTEHRVRRAAGLPLAKLVGVRTRPHLKVVRDPDGR